MFRHALVTGLLAAALPFVAACGVSQESEEASEPVEAIPLEVTVVEQQPTTPSEDTSAVGDDPEPQVEPTEDTGDPTPEEAEATEEPAETEATDEPADSADQPASEGDAAVGETLFQNTCAACHGPDAKGLPDLGKDLTTSEFVKGLTDAELVAFITEGRPISDPANTRGVAMPPKGGNPALSDEDLFDIVAYIRTLQE